MMAWTALLFHRSDETAGNYDLLSSTIFLICLTLAHVYVLASLFLAFGSAVLKHDASKYAGSLDKYYSTHECCKCRFPETVENELHLKTELRKLESKPVPKNES